MIIFGVYLLISIGVGWLFYDDYLGNTALKSVVLGLTWPVTLTMLIVWGILHEK
jgi:hypothetical protein